ncbi:type I-E CRISPR-associated protein Cse1/CasA [Chlorobium sp. N1]|uniref:type I-E CRISPR-associated protein Cse1/CasA n=1 Tax=Chlorobium sp. N1 TaxID=2491138 RepID=UPI00103C637A|nr:type I-E CRISPR-associated protein Cse1/CasA [Chlorobium sp. N1]TCD46919.1 type I-E CRISPR-associated protein Cse1/CasA [Chlorobium sp. N1]
MNTVHTVSGQQRFNLVDEPWIPVVSKGLLSLRQVFSEPDNPALGGNPIQKIALTKLLLAIGQAACTPTDTAALNALDAIAFRSSCLTYLDKWHDRFWLYGERPFLQMPRIKVLIEDRLESELHSATKKAAIKKAKENALPKAIGAGFYPDVQADNDSILTQHQASEISGDAERALFILTLMNFAFAGKHFEKNLRPLTPEYSGKGASAKSGPSIGNHVGYLHSFLTGPFLIDTIMLNLLSSEQVQENPYWKSGIGTPPWERMPEGEGCAVALSLKASYMATLVSLSRFVILDGDGVFYVEGLQYPSHKDGWLEPSMLFKAQDKTPKVAWVDPNQRPWRELPAMLAFLGDASPAGGICLFLRYGLDRAKRRHPQIGIWSGGLRVRYQIGGQSVKQDDDFVESLFRFDSSELDANWYDRFKIEMKQLEDISTFVSISTKKYIKKLEPKSKNKKDSPLAINLAKKSSTLFWQLAERHVQELVDACEDTERLPSVRRTIASLAFQAFDAFCPKDTARQIDAWASSRPNLSKYLFNN